MSQDFSHISDEDLLLAVDGELTGRHASKVRAHLATCWHCRARLAELEDTIVNFARAHRHTLDPKLPSSDGPHALLRAHISSLVTGGTTTMDLRAMLRIAALCILLVAAAYGASQIVRVFHPADTAHLQHQGLLPDPHLTPGAVNADATEQLCAMEHEIVVGEVTVPLRQQVLDEYRIPGERMGQYEIDYLISPGLGGTQTIQNLWPQPTSSKVWNSTVKDALEERLHQMVCNHQLDLPTAQHDIATNWIDAYKKYFHSNAPLPAPSDLAESLPQQQIHPAD
jgi:hypothetical protein